MNRLVLLILAALISTGCGDDSVGPGSGDGNGFVTGEYVVFAWNDLGMHCLNDTYDKAVILPPYNNIWAQVIKRGDPPQVVTSGLTVEYYLAVNTYSYGKRDYGQFWDNAADIFRSFAGFTAPPVDVGLAGKGLFGEMESAAGHFIAEGVPVTPVYDSGTWDPYQVAVITVKNDQGAVVATTRATVPVSDEINCAQCHGEQAWSDIISDHDRLHETGLADSIPFLCASCHGSPALGTQGAGAAGIYLSEAIHGAHSTREASCYQCHPGEITKCMRSRNHTATDGNCQTCHGTLAHVASSIEAGRIPWAGEPSCGQCHSGVPGMEPQGTLFRNATGHGSVNCAACHNSPHAMYPSELDADNLQPLQYQGYTGLVKTIGSCGVCHEDSRGEVEDIGEFSEKHGGSSPERSTACNTCHTVVRYDTSKWPHAWGWNNSRD
ncbi:MAG: hypothetical protein JW814_02925 [Candidatus Krumholzibacteriota bacterium]|nr:hypothetical protein [Candidatus Krumholzibacteriota bacterium]